MKFSEYIKTGEKYLGESLSEKKLAKIVMSKTDFTEKEFNYWLHGGSPNKNMSAIISLKLDAAKIKHEDGRIEDMTQFGIKQSDYYDLLDELGV